jgi:hypothetical protein
MRRGTSIRVGWAIDGNGDGVADVSHWADASFLTEWQGEVFAQVPDIQRQAPRIDPTRIEMPAVEQRWTGLLGTTGTLSGHFSDGTAAPAARLSARGVSPTVRRRPGGSSTSTTQTESRSPARRTRCSTPYAAATRFAWSGARPSPRWARTFGRALGRAGVRDDHEWLRAVRAAPEHIAQASYVDPEKAVFDDPAVMWRGLMGTNGTFDAVYVDRSTGKEVRHLPQRVRLAWFAMAPEPACAPQPIVLAVPGGVRRVP